MSDDIGSLAWGRRTRGLLRWNDRVQLIFGAVINQVATSWAFVRDTPSARRVELDVLRLPDSAVVRLATEQMRDQHPDFIINHCLRTYCWGAILGQLRALKYDQEVFAVAALLHDLGLSKSFSTSSHQCCFAVAGAEGALKVLQRSAWPVDRREAVANAIALHINVSRVTLQQGSEAHLLQAGAVLDVIGTHYREIPPDLLIETLTCHPRLLFKRSFASLWQSEARAQPGTRAALMNGTLSLGKLIRRSPFEE